MPLYKRKPFHLVETPKDLKPHEPVFQIRFTKEIFRAYGQYLDRINLYRQRVWTCKVSAKCNLTYEEALVSEKRAAEKVQQFPKELVVPVLRDIQFSMLTLKDLVNHIVTKLQEGFLEGVELQGRKNNRIYPCKIVKVLQESDKARYQVDWLDKDKKITGHAVVSGEDLIKKKLPISRDVLKSFIRESTYRSVPWVLHDKLARKHGISTDPPEVMRGKISLQDGRVVCDRKRKKHEEDRCNGVDSSKKCKRKKLEKDRSETFIAEKNAEKGEDKGKKEPIKYPIDDLLVQPGSDDPAFTQRPSPSREFNIPMDCVGDLLMLSPFSLEDFENALCHKDSNVILIVESHSTLLRLLMKDNGDYAMAIQKKKRKPKMTIITWIDYLCDFLEMVGVAELSTCITTIRRGHYGLLDVRAKLGIFRELIGRALSTDLVREKLDEDIEETQLLAATRRGEALEEGRRMREDKERLKAESSGKEVKEDSILDSVFSSSNEVANGSNRPNGDVVQKWNGKVLPSRAKHTSRNSSELQKRSKEEANRILLEEAMVRRSTRVRAPPRDSPAVAFLKYLNKWKGE
ncbi:hypothetical protein RJ639_017947 [Escallonia herrerae]|uniref:WAC domain-containing protein n=1 Tax=Escallonia herrerae TaxID=1293975 RepID=A0AA89AIK6_9ASTE|nr:hypothetical protein RJ639_017947 [Escallonia herrerae]